MVESSDPRDLAGKRQEPAGDRCRKQLKELKEHDGDQKPSGLFESTEDIKARVRNSLLKPDPHTVADFYHHIGIWRWLAVHPVFENTTLAVISLNAVYIAVDTDHNSADTLLDAHPVFQFMEHAFCLYFTLEWLVRFKAFKLKKNCFRDAWFVFDSALVFMMVGETWVLTAVQITTGSGESPLGNMAILRLARLLRLSRLMRMLKSFPELMILIKGMVTAMKSVGYVMVLLILVTYVFAIAFTQLAAGTEMGENYFENVALSMYSLIVYGTFLDALSDFCNDIKEESAACMFLVVIFICLSALTVMNMLIGVLCEVISAVADAENEELRTAHAIEKMRGVTESIDTDSNGMISHKEFMLILDTDKAIEALNDVGVDPVGLVDFVDIFFVKEGEQIELEFEKFMELVLDLRGTNTATVKDMMHLGKAVRDAKENLQGQITNVKQSHDRVGQKLDAVLTAVGKLTEAQERPRARSSANNSRYTVSPEKLIDGKNWY